MTEDRAKRMEQIRKLLAQAENTTHPEEAATYLAKAQQMMTDHGIDEALARASGAPRVDFIARESVPFDSRTQLVKAKRALLNTIALHNNCVCLMDSAKNLHIQGYGNDRARVQMLFTSMLSQMEQAVRLQGRTDVTYRNNFSWAFVNRVHERLAAATQASWSARGGGAELAIRDTMTEVQASVGKLRTAPRGKARQYDATARAHGTLAGDRAQLNAQATSTPSQPTIGS